ncbi:MAG: electron transport complex subunit RsxC [Gammaproteobacteria bacterium]|nr:MAG: electron transport complex subunit RsxC [Gammaproteobacteria bacterium]
MPGHSPDLHSFHGGLRLPGNRERTSAVPIRQAGIPPMLVLPLLQHIGEVAECLVTPGERVLKGQMIAAPRGDVSAPVHASSSGTVVAIEPRPYPHPSGLPAPAIIIETDGKDEWLDSEHGLANYHEIEAARLLDHIRQSGIVGLGGAGFPTQVKLGSSVYHNIELLVINGAECEPYLSCDNRLMQERAAEILEGVRILQHLLKPDNCIIALENHMGAAREAMQVAVDNTADRAINLVSVPDIYPSGGERQLIRILTGKEVPSQGFPADIGILCQNVGTATAIYQAVVHNRPLVSRIVTVTGAGVKQPCNLEALIGTPFLDMITACGGYADRVDRLLMGGPMMGFAVNTDNVPVIKTTNCILAVTRDEMPPPPPEQPCIRCSKCTDVCPADLLPQQLFWHARSGNLDAAQDYNLFDCIECGCCAYVCPSHIPLVQYYRHSKAEIWTRDRQKQASDIARRRHDARKARLERIKQERAERLARKKQQLGSSEDTAENTRKAAIQAALERVRRKKAQTEIAPKNVDNLTAEQQQRIHEVDERRQQSGKDPEQ